VLSDDGEHLFATHEISVPSSDFVVKSGLYSQVWASLESFRLAQP
jgi:hypothetical protein